MEVKKKFKLIDDIKEEEFLNEKSREGYLLDKYDGETYYFKESDKKVFYLIEFFYKHLSSHEVKVYKKKGYDLLYVFESDAKGYYYYFISKEKVKDLDRNLKDRYQNLLASKTRVDRFTSIIFISTFSLFTFLYFKSGEQVYIMVLLLTVLLGGYFGNIYIETIKRLSEYSEILLKKEGELDGDDEGCCE